MFETENNLKEQAVKEAAKPHNKERLFNAIDRLCLSGKSFFSPRPPEVLVKDFKL